MTIRPLREGDGAALEAITRQSPEAARWLPKIRAGEAGWAAETENRVVGFLVARIMADEMEILNLAVDPGERGRGVGGALLEAAIDHGHRSRARRVFLEVRESNRRAQRFYERRGFVAFGRRRRYYSNPQEDALLMARGLGEVE